MSERGALVLLDEAHQYAVTWNGSCTFGVWAVLTNGFATRYLREITCFTTTEAPVDEDAASAHAWRWWADYGLAHTQEQERFDLGAPAPRQALGALFRLDDYR